MSAFLSTAFGAKPVSVEPLFSYYFCLVGYSGDANKEYLLILFQENYGSSSKGSQMLPSRLAGVTD